MFGRLVWVASRQEVRGLRAPARGVLGMPAVLWGFTVAAVAAGCGRDPEGAPAATQQTYEAGLRALCAGEAPANPQAAALAAVVGDEARPKVQRLLELRAAAEATKLAGCPALDAMAQFEPLPSPQASGPDGLRFGRLEGELAAVWGEGDRAVGEDAVSALGNMFGDNVGEAQRFGGLGVAGAGRGGGGTGIGNGRGASRLAERTGKVPKVIPGKPIIHGTLDKETIRRVIRRHRTEYKYCYEKRLNSRPELNGKVTLKFTIAGNGAVVGAAVASSTVADAELDACLVAKVKRWIFPAPPGGGIVVVQYPFIFKPS